MATINFYKWAFRFTIWIAIIQVVIFFLVLNFNPFTQDELQFLKRLEYLGFTIFMLFLGAVLTLIIGFVKKEPQKYQFWIALLLCIGCVFNLFLGTFGKYIIM
ncbi:hypothetical protein KORDIASMS9_03101 [Kordia sp. SMS9]|uniref:hypothetical protein n=1 Tax=Kordia sp. SMS9 TaxID=2282170 RepID=UPI000E0D31F8|nr:hypothetical protein [Kordia sp. SMS9]AXG70854.1 hypothetical protein KORDIASMS9_03101 [Kordia sp. SMS9]